MTKWLILGLLLAGCAPRAVPIAGYRQSTSQISSIALFEQARMAGEWVEVAGYPLAAGCQPGAVSFSDAGATASGTGCYLPLRAAATMAPAGPGRMAANGAVFWVLWVDESYRTAVIGTPSGQFAAVLNRDKAIPADRLEAARRVLRFNGYDPDQMQGMR